MSTEVTWTDANEREWMRLSNVWLEGNCTSEEARKLAIIHQNRCLYLRITFGEGLPAKFSKLPIRAVRKFTKEQERKWRVLIRKEAKGKITNAECKELAKIQRLRHQAHPETKHEVKELLSSWLAAKKLVEDFEKVRS